MIGREKGGCARNVMYTRLNTYTQVVSGIHVCIYIHISYLDEGSERR